MGTPDRIHDDGLVVRRAKPMIMPVNRKMISAEHAAQMEIYLNDLDNMKDTAIAEIEMEANRRIIEGAAMREMDSYERMLKRAASSRVMQRIVVDRLEMLTACDDNTIMRTRR